jgi:hypothetical protein
MNYSKTVLVSILIVLTINIYGQQTERKYRKLKNLSKYHLVKETDSIEPFYISKNPITNREYLTYICWVSDVYRSYPKVLLNALPGLDSNYINSLLENGFTVIQIKSAIDYSNLTKFYMFNPKYLDYPVVGLKWTQAMNYLNWLSDRYNESILIGKYYLKFDPNQFGDASFNSEAYMLGFYEGSRDGVFSDPETNIPRNVMWKDRMLAPSFRLPSQFEIRISESEINSSIEEYKANKFLKNWTDYYIVDNNNQLKLKINGDSYLSFAENNTIDKVDPESFEVTEMTLDNIPERKEVSVLKIFSDMEQNVVSLNPNGNIALKDSVGRIPFIQIDGDYIRLKDSLGHMPIILIAEDENLDPIFIKRIDYPKENTVDQNNKKVFSIFRYALYGIKE